MRISFNKFFYKTPFFYFFLFNLVLFIKTGFPQSTFGKVLVGLLLVFQLYLAMTEQFHERERNKWLIGVFCLLSFSVLLQGCSFSTQATNNN